MTSRIAWQVYVLKNELCYLRKWPIKLWEGKQKGLGAWFYELMVRCCALKCLECGAVFSAMSLSLVELGEDGVSSQELEGLPWLGQWHWWITNCLILSFVVEGPNIMDKRQGNYENVCYWTFWSFSQYIQDFIQVSKSKLVKIEYALHV